MKNKNLVSIKFRSGSSGNATNYSNLSQTEIIEILQKSILDNTLMGSNIKIGQNNKTYIFTLKNDPYESKKGKIIISTNPKLYDANDANILALDSISKSIGKVTINRNKAIIAIIAAGAITLASYGPAIGKFASESFKSMANELAKMDNANFQKENSSVNSYLDEINKSREEEGLRPIQMTEEEWEQIQKEETSAKRQAEIDYLNNNPEEQFRRELEQSILEKNKEESKGMKY